MHFCFLYIDPGTGSMLFSIVISLVSMVFFLGKAAFLKIRFFFTGGKSKALSDHRHPFVIYNEDKRYWSVFSPIVDEFERRGIDVTYYTSSQDDPIFSGKYTHVFPEYIGDGNKAFSRLNLLEADVCLMTTPGLDVYQLKRSKGVKHYSHVLHSVDDATGYRLFGIDYYDSILLSGEYQKQHLRFLEEKRSLKKRDLVVVGCPYLDMLKKNVANIPVESDHRPTVLVAPSWGPSSLLVLYGTRLLDPLVKSGYRVIIRPHPQSVKTEKNVLEPLVERYRDSESVQWDYSRENLETLSRSDFMISDFSGVIFDYVFIFNRPFMYVNQSFELGPYDAYDVPETPWKFRILPEIGVALEEKDFEVIKDRIDSAINDRKGMDRRAQACAYAWENQGCSDVRIVDYLVQKKMELSPEDILPGKR